MVRVAANPSLNWLKNNDIKAVAIVGICKNAGKTTLLNYLLAQNSNLTWGVFSTGLDGEDTDQVFRVPKPRVKLDSGTIFCCDTPTLDGHGSAVSVLAELPKLSPHRPLWLAKAQIPVQTQITGPASMNDQIRVLRKIQALGAEKVLIDGALDRKSIALSDAVDAVIVLIGASYGSTDAIRTEIKRLQTLNRLEQYISAGKGSQYTAPLLDSESIWITRVGEWIKTEIESLIGIKSELQTLLGDKPEKIYIPGVITDSVLSRIRTPLLESGAGIILRHPDCLKLSFPKLERFVQDFEPKVMVPFKIKNYFLNTASIGSQAVDAGEFRQKLRSEFPGLGFVDIRELEYDRQG
ncbi:MAG: hypothetical protein R6T89_07665 [Candidatus Syntrophosphaera sp.]